jgi:hypothetical protein
MYCFKFTGTVNSIKGGKLKGSEHTSIYVNACNEQHAWLILTTANEQGIDLHGEDLHFTGEARPLSPDWICPRCYQYQNR